MFVKIAAMIAWLLGCAEKINVRTFLTDGAYSRKYRVFWWVPTIGVVGLVCASLSGCSGFGKKAPEASYSKRVVEYGRPVPKGGGRYKIGKPYKIAGEWYYPRENRNYDRVGIASWYGDKFHGRYTANGEVFDMDALTAAHPTLPMPVYAKVTNMANGRSLVVRVNDRGPYKHNRVIDLSRYSATLLGFKKRGTARVRVQYLGKAPLNGDDRYERQYLAQQRWRGRRFVSQHVDTLAVGATTQSRLPLPAAGQFSSRQSPLFVRAGSFRVRENAERFRSHLSNIGPANIDLTETSNGPLFLVLMGPYYETTSADKALENVIALGAGDAVIVAR